MQRGEIRAGEGGMSEEEIDYNVAGTFPASDPPSWTLGLRDRKKSVTEFEGAKPSAYDPSHQNEPTPSAQPRAALAREEQIFYREGMTMATKRREAGTRQRGAGRGRSAGASSRQESRSLPQGDGRQQGGGLKNKTGEQLARGLGWFSLGLGLAEVLAPRGVAKIVGVQDKNAGLIRLFGLREIASGVGIFAQGRRPAAAVWSRVAGDALDLAALGAAFASPNSRKGRVAFATANVLAVTALDVLCAQQLSGNDRTTTGGAARVEKSLIINRPPEEIYQFWRNFENLPRFMRHLESVRVTGERRSRWVAKAPAGTTVEWDAELTEDRPNELIAWRSLEGADVENSGSVRFEPAPGNRGTIVRVEIDYNPPGGALGAAVAKLFGEEPGQQAQESLRCLKQVMETGEVVVSEGTVWDNGLLTQRPAQPIDIADFGLRNADLEERSALSTQGSAGHKG